MISFILLASGFGRRFGSNKLMAKIDGKEMYLHMLEKLKLSAADLPSEAQVIVISQYEEILKKAKDYGMKAVFNGEAEEGIAASVRHGVRAAEESEWYFFFMADQPYLKEDTIKQFVNAVCCQEKSMASVCAGEIPGSPTAFHKKWGSRLLALSGDVGGRKIMKQFPSEVFWYGISGQEIVDIDFDM